MLCHIRHLGWKGFVAEVDGSAHEGEATFGDTITACVRELGDQAMSAQQL